MTTHRTEDTEYGKDYWDSLDSGAGYKDSLLWSDMSHILHEVFFVDKEANVDRAGEHRVLDMGCAYGYLVRHINARGTECFGLDYSRYALEHAPEDVRGNIQWFDLTGPRATFYGPEAFTLVTCFETLEHIPATSAERALQHLWNSLKPGGILVATICVEGQPDPHSDPTHVNVASRAWWEDRLRKTGFWLQDIQAHELRRFWLFSAHKGVFVARKPPLTHPPS